MKLHLPLSLRYALFSLMVIAAPVQAVTMHSDATLVTYTDFGQNKGRYVNDSKTNALLQYIRREEGGIAISYTDGTAPSTIPVSQGTPNFSATIDEGCAGLISPNLVATAAHQLQNIWSYNLNGRELGALTQQYDVINVGLNGTFSLRQPEGTSGDYDYMLLRYSRIVTDAEAYTLTTQSVSSLKDTAAYHSGAGSKYWYDAETGETTKLSNAYTYITGGIVNINGAGYKSGSTYEVSINPGATGTTGVTKPNPLPVGPKSGDSGSPLLVYNAEEGRYEYVAALRVADSAASRMGAWAIGNIDWTLETMAKLDAVINLSQVSEVHLGQVNQYAGEKSDSGYQTTLYTGTATDANGNEIGSYIGLHYDKSTWKNMKEATQWTAGDWYHYNPSNFQSAQDVDLFFTQNLVFTNPTEAETRIVLDATVDTGIGYTEFGKGELEKASFIIESKESGNYQLHTSGYVIHEDTEVHLRLVNPEDFFSEWRKIGEGDLHIDGQGDTYALLNVGGKGKTYLNQSGGHAAYNVLVNTGATVVLSAGNGTAQIERDFTFGAGGGVLDMNGNSMDWYTTTESQADDSRFSIHAQTEEAVITNNSDTNTVSTLAYKQGGETTYFGSFVDTANGALVVDYQGGGTWTLNSIRTDLTNHRESKLLVSNGSVRLVGTNTVHALGSATGTNTDRYTNGLDWHYADAAMNVTVGTGARFELGSHARLTGDVTVQQGGTYVMREGVTHALEYVEGGQQLEDTSRYAAFYGHKGGVNLNGGTFAVLFNEGADSTLSYSGTVSGTGKMIVNTGRDGGVFEFSGVTDSTVQKVVDGGLLRLSGAAAADTENKWLVNTGGVVVENGGVAETLRLINTGSTGAIALVQNRVEQVDLGNHAGMSIGAFNGMVVQYGQAGTSEQLNTWRLGGGGGELVVNYQLSGSHELVLGASSEARGTVTLAGSTETYTGKILVQGITLNAGLLENEIVLNNGCLNVQGELSGKFNASNITGNGTLQLSFSDDIANNELALQEGLQADVHLNKGSVQYNAASSFGGNWTLHDGATLRLGDKVDSVSDTLKLAVSGRGELQGSGDYSFAAGTISGSGEFVNAISGNVTIADLSNLAHYTHASEGTTTIAKASTTVNALSVTAGNVYLETDNDCQRVKGNIVVDGGALHFSSAGTSDMLDYSLPGRSIQVKNGTLDFGTTRQTMGSWSLILGDAALVTGNGDATYGAIDFNENSTILATEGTSEIAAATRIRNGKTLTYDISEDATVNVTGRVFAQGSDKANIIKSGDGTLVFSSTANNYKGTTTIQAGTLKTNNLASLGAVSLAQGSCLELTAYTVSTSLDSISGSGKLSLVFAEKGEKVIEGAFGFDLAIAGAGTVKKTGGQSLNFNVDVNSGATFIFGGDDVIDYGADSRKLTVSGGILDFGTTRQTMGKMDIYLKDGARVTGSGGSYNVNGDHNAALDYDVSDSTIYAARGTSTIEAVTRLRSTTEGGVNLNYDVSKDATLTVSGLIHADDVTGSGSITKLGEGTLVLAGANTYSGTTTVNAGVLRASTDGALGTTAVVINGGVLELDPAGGEGVNASILKGAVTVNNGGTLRLGGSDNKVVDTNVTINAGGRMEFTGSGSDMIDYTDGKSKTITVNGGVIDFGTTRQTMQNTSLVLKNGAKLEGAGGSYGASYTAALDYNKESTIVAESGDNVIDSNIRIRDVKLTFDVRDDAELALNGRMHYDTNDGKRIVVEKQGGGRMEVNSLVKLATLNPKGGELVLAHTGAQNVLGMLDVSQGGTSRGTLSLAQNVDLKVTGKIYGCSTSAIKLESGAQLTSTEDGVIVAHGGGTGSASIVCNASDGEYSVGNADFEFNNVRLKYDSSWERTLSNKLTNSTIENMNAGGKTLTVDNKANTLVGVVAGTGGMILLNQETLALNVLEVAAGKMVSAYAGADNQSAKTAVTVSSTALFGAGATLSASSLTLNTGATLEMSGTAGAVKMDGTALTFNSGLKLGGTLLEVIAGLEEGESFTLFTGVASMHLQQTVTLYNMRSLAEQTEEALSYSTLMDGQQVAAADYFSNLSGNSGLVLRYDSTDGSVSIAHVAAIPEPATATLSLLALAGLAARRRRR